MAGTLVKNTECNTKAQAAMTIIPCFTRVMWCLRKICSCFRIYLNCCTGDVGGLLRFCIRHLDILDIKNPITGNGIGMRYDTLHPFTIARCKGRTWINNTLEQVYWLPSNLLTRLPMVSHSGLVSVRSRYSCGDSGLTALPLSKEIFVPLVE